MNKSKTVKVGNFDYQLSTKKDKKLMVKTPDGKTIHFGGNPTTSKHYYDKTGLLNKKLNHNDDKTRKNWKARHGKITTKDGKLAYKNPNQSSYHSWNVLW